jgi:hypothetical protein
MSFAIGIVFLLAVSIGVVFAIRFLSNKQDEKTSGDLELIAYGLLAVAVGVSTFSIIGLLGAAFPDQTIVGGSGDQAASALAGLVVAGPIAAYLWRRQALRRETHPATVGWPIYLAVIELVFMTGLVVAGFNVVNRIIGDGNAAPWTELTVFILVVGLHEYAARRNPPETDAAELPRVVGSAIGLIPTAIGVSGILYWLFESVYATFAASAGDFELGTALSFLIVGLPVWYFSWLRPWPQETGASKKIWLVVTSVTGLYTAISSTVAIVIAVVTYVFGDPDSAAEHFELLPITFAILIVATAIWFHHRQGLGDERTDSLRAYEYLNAAIALGFLIGSLTALSAVAFGDDDLIGSSDAALPLSIVVVIVASAVTWWTFWKKAQSAPREAEATAIARRIYLLGGAVIAGLTSAQALIASLVDVFQAVFDVESGSDLLVVQGPLFVFSGLTTWHLVRTNSQDKDLFESGESVKPFSVSVVCSYPGPLAELLPKEAKLRVVYRADGEGTVDEVMASQIVEAVGNGSSLVWVSENGFEVAPARFD